MGFIHFFCPRCLTISDLFNSSDFLVLVMDLVITLLLRDMMDMFLILPPVLSMSPTCWSAPQSKSSLTSSGQESLDAW